MLLDLPPELRLRIYDYVLQPLLESPEHHDTYVRPDEWPRKSFATYRALLLTCGTVKAEIQPHFARHFAPHIMVFFDNVRKLADFVARTRAAEQAGALSTMKVSVRTRIVQRESSPDMLHFYQIIHYVGFVCDLQGLLSHDDLVQVSHTANDIIFQIGDHQSLLRDEQKIVARSIQSRNGNVKIRRDADDAVGWSTYIEFTARIKGVNPEFVQEVRGKDWVSIEEMHAAKAIRTLNERLAEARQGASVTADSTGEQNEEEDWCAGRPDG